MAVSPDDLIGQLVAAGLTREQAAQFRDYLAYVADQANAAAEKMEEAIYEQTRAAMSNAVDEKALARAREMAARRAEELAVGLAQGELQKLGEAVAQGLEQGLGPREIARQLDMVQALDPQRAGRYQKYLNYLDSIDPALSKEEWERRAEAFYQKELGKRRETIARTEAREATSTARTENARMRGAQYKYSISVGDDRVSDVCQDNEAQGPIAFDEDFESGDERPPFHPNCRCTLGFLTSDAQKDRADQAAKDRAERTAESKANEE